MNNTTATKVRLRTLVAVQRFAAERRTVVVTDHDGNQHVGRVRADLDPSYFLVVDLADGRWIRTDVGSGGGTITVLEATVTEAAAR